MHVIVTVPAVVLVAVVNLKVPASSPISPVALAQVLPTVSVAPTAIPINPPPDGIVIEPVVNGSEASISLEPSPPSADNVVLAPITLYTPIWLAVSPGLVVEYVTAIVAVVPVGHNL